MSQNLRQYKRDYNMADDKPAKSQQGKEYVKDDKVAARVSALASFGVPELMIANHLGMARATLRKYYMEEMQVEKVDKNQAVQGMLYYTAVVDKNVTALIFIAKTQLGWRETKDSDAELNDIKEAMLKALALKLPE